MVTYKIGNYEIHNVCTSHGIQYGVQKMPKRPNVKSGICDICEATGTKNAPQSVLPVSDYQGLMINDSNGLITMHK